MKDFILSKLMRIFNGYISVVLIFVIISCKNEMKFNSKDWNEREDLFYSKRKFVVNDLITNHLKVGMRYDEIIRLLGKPSYESIQENSEIHYEILEKYGWNIDPEEIQYLDIKLNKDSTFASSNIRITK